MFTNYANTNKTKVWKISDQKVACTSGGAKECLLVKKGCLKGWEPFTGVIENFNYISGNQYKIKVVENAVQNSASLVSILQTKNVSKLNANNSLTTLLSNKLQIVKVNGKKVNSEKAFMSINVAENTVFGNGGCNGFNGDVSLNGSKITFKEFRTTMMACIGNDIDVQERAILNAIRNQTLEVKQQGEFISLMNGNEEVIVLKNRTSKETAEILSKYFWQLTMLENVGKDYGKMGLNFSTADNMISGFSGCNSFSGKMNLDGNTIYVKELLSTMKACLGGDINANEAKFLEILQNSTLTFDLIGENLTLYKNGKSVASFMRTSK